MGPRVACTLVLGIALAACAEPRSELDAGARTDGAVHDAGSLDAGLDAQASTDATITDAATIDSGLDGGADAGTTVEDAGTMPPADAGPLDAGTPVFDVRVLADSACSDLSFDPPSIAVPAGTSFTVNWINATGCTEIDIDKDGTVPIVLGLEPGTSYHDTIREWCGIFTGTFFFRAYYAPSFPYYLDVDCSR